MTTDVLLFVAGVLVTEAITELLVEAEPLEGFRDWWLTHTGRMGSLFWCGYCVSFWVGQAVAWPAMGIMWSEGVGWAFVVGVLLHRLSNIWHVYVVRIVKGEPLFWRTTSASSQREDTDGSSTPAP